MSFVRAFDASREERDEWRHLTRELAQQNQYPVFRVVANSKTSLGYTLEYSWSAGGLYLAISHSWTDRTGGGDTVHVDDLAPWPLTMSPAKTGLLKWLSYLQDQAMAEGGAAWFWLDLFCIDQSWEDESLFATQLQQIPDVFGNAAGCVALIASWPCSRAESLVLPPRTDSKDDSNSDWKALRQWTQEHDRVCNCIPVVDAWMTRVWTRQELLYSREIILCSATEWLHEDTPSFSDDVWNSKSPFYHNIRPKEGLDEFASCLMTWAEKHHRTYTSAGITAIAVALIRGQSVPQSVTDLERSKARDTYFGEWFAFNWAMILNGSIRRTTKARDAILSQMLLLPGYNVPPMPRYMSLQDIAADASMQFRRLVKAYQLLPLDLSIWQGQEGTLYRAMRHAKRQPTLSEVLEAVGSPCQISTFPPLHATWPISAFVNSSTCLLAYRPRGNPNYEVKQAIDLIHNPTAALGFFLQLKLFWDTLEGCAIETRVWTRLKALEAIYGATSPAVEQSVTLSESLEEIVWYMLTGREKMPLASDEGAVDDLSSPLPERLLPPLRAVTVTYEDSPTHVNLLFGDLPSGSRGPLFALGQDKGHKCELAVVGDLQDDNQIVLRAFGAIMSMTGRTIMGWEDIHTGLYEVRGPQRRGKAASGIQGTYCLA